MGLIDLPTRCYSCASRDFTHSVPVTLLPAKWQSLRYSAQFNTDMYLCTPSLHTPHRNSCCYVNLTPPVKEIYPVSCVLSSTEENTFDFYCVGRNVYLLVDIAGENMCIVTSMPPSLYLSRSSASYLSGIQFNRASNLNYKQLQPNRTQH